MFWRLVVCPSSHLTSSCDLLTEVGLSSESFFLDLLLWSAEFKAPYATPCIRAFANFFICVSDKRSSLWKNSALAGEVPRVQCLKNLSVGCQEWVAENNKLMKNTIDMQTSPWDKPAKWSMYGWRSKASSSVHAGYLYASTLTFRWYLSTRKRLFLLTFFGGWLDSSCLFAGFTAGDSSGWFASFTTGVFTCPWPAVYIYICIYNCFSPCPIGLSPLEWFQFLLLLSLPMIKAPNSRAQPVQNRSYECKKCKGNGSTNGKRSRAKVIGANHWAKSTCLSGPVLEVQGFKVFGIRVSGQLREG